MTARRKAYLVGLAVWPLFLVSAVTLGAVREMLIAPSFGEQAAEVIGTLLFIAPMLGIMWVFVGTVSAPEVLGYGSESCGVFLFDVVVDENVGAGRNYLPAILGRAARSTGQVEVKT